jgi:replicative DNA helicase
MVGGEGSGPENPFGSYGGWSAPPDQPGGASAGVPPMPPIFEQRPAPRAPGGRLPPHNLEAERSVLGAILLNNESFHKVVDVGLEARDFYREVHQKIFDALHALAERGEPVDLVTLTAALRDRGWYEQIGGTATLTSLFEDAFAVGNVTYYAKIIREKALLRRVIETASEITAEAFDNVEDTEAFLDEAERKIFGVSDSKLNKSFASMQSILVENMHAIEELAQKKSDVIGLATGFHDFDKLTSGLRGGQLMILAARPAMGKTSLFLSAAQNIALSANRPVVAIFSLEMSKEELGFRFLSGLARIDSKRLKVGRLADRDWTRLAQAADALSKSKIFIDDSGDLTVMDIRARCRRLVSMEKRLDLIVVDYLQLMKGSKAASKDGAREREISEISRNLKNLAKELKVPIIALSQLNRGVESRPNKRPMLSDLRESGAIEQDADIVCFIYRDEVYNKDTEDRGVAELIVAKHRAGETDTIRLAWLAEYTLFANLAGNAPGTPIAPPRPDQGDVGL